MMIKILSNSFDSLILLASFDKKNNWDKHFYEWIDGHIDADHVIDPISVSDSSSPLIQTIAEYMKYLPS